MRENTRITKKFLSSHRAKKREKNTYIHKDLDLIEDLRSYKATDAKGKLCQEQSELRGPGESQVVGRTSRRLLNRSKKMEKLCR